MRKEKKIKEQINEIDEWSISDVVNGFIPFTQTIVTRNYPGLKDFLLQSYHLTLGETGFLHIFAHCTEK